LILDAHVHLPCYADRIIFGTDYGDCCIEDHIDLVNSLNIDNYAKQRILYNNAVKLYKLKI